MTVHDALGIKFVEQVILNDTKTYYRRLDEHPHNNVLVLLDNSLEVRRLNRDKILDIALL